MNNHVLVFERFTTKLDTIGKNVIVFIPSNELIFIKEKLFQKLIYRHPVYPSYYLREIQLIKLKVFEPSY